MAESGKYSPGLMRFVPFLGYHHVLMILLVVPNVLLSILIAGCTTSNTLPSIYILSISYLSNPSSSTPSTIQLNPNISSTFSTLALTHSPLEVRVSYLGICISQVSSEWVCASNAQALANLMKMYDGSNSAEHDPLNLIWIAGKFKDGMLFSGLLLTAIPLSFLTFILLATFPGWHVEEAEGGPDDDSYREVKPYPARPISQVALYSLLIACLFTFIAILVQHVASATGSSLVESLSYGQVGGKVGSNSMVLGWAGLVIYVIVGTCLGDMIFTILLHREDFSENEADAAPDRESLVEDDVQRER